MENKAKSYKEIFQEKYQKLKNDLENVIRFLNEPKEKKESLETPPKNKNIEQLEKTNKELKTELREKTDLIQTIKSESNNMLQDLKRIITNLTKNEDDK